MEIHDCKVFQHDGAPCHRAKAVTKWLQENEVTVLAPWPGKSPDLNIIENCWTIVKKEVAATIPSSMTDLIAAINVTPLAITKHVTNA